MRIAFVTGSTGFLGLNLIGELKTGDWEIYALHLPGEDLRCLNKLNVIPVAGNILDPGSLVRAIPEKADAVFHVAGDTSMWERHRDRQYAINVIGTRNVVNASIAKHAGRFIHTSSISAYGYHPGTVVSEHTASNALSCKMNYNITKYLAEQEVRKGMDAGLSAVIMNPCNIIGPYDRSNWSQIIKSVLHDALPGIPPGKATFAHVKDIARAHIAAVDKGRPGENYILGGICADFKEVINEIQRLLGKPAGGNTVSRGILRLAMYSSMLRSLIGRGEPSITPAKYKRLVGALLCDDRKAGRELGFATRPLDRMLADSYEWLKQENLLES
ncbi:MAG: NAD-dependent epimerase/dehydratase family protein [Spirochaetes bacterium]|nr:MAG: NAD-dependent epimerase/dehydratase family protein [Spirochaetota bacterium]